MKQVQEYKHRAQVPIRLTFEDFEKLKIKAHTDDLTVQSIMETLILEYLRDNKYIMKLLAPLEKKKRGKNRKYVTESDSRKLLDQIERESPLQDL